MESNSLWLEGKTLPSGVPAGIDLGTSYSCIGVWQNDRVNIVSNDLGNPTTPSYVAFTEETQLVGDPAKGQAGRNPENTIFDAKRLIGRKFSDHSVQREAKLCPFRLVKGKNDMPLFEVQH